MAKRKSNPVGWELPFETLGALHFLAGGHYLWRVQNGKSFKSKFVTAADVVAAFTQQEQDSGWMPAGVVRCGQSVQGEWFVYSAPAQRVKVVLEGEDTPGEVDGAHAGAPQRTIPVPRTVMVGIGKVYYLWVVKGKYFEPGLEAYYAPFPNVYGDGKICWGENKPGEAKAGRARQVWEMFFATPFNAHLASGKSRTARNDVREALRRLEGEREYAVEDLVGTGAEIGRTVENVLNVRTLER